MEWYSRFTISYTMYSIYVLMINWIEVLVYVWAFCMSLILGSYILCG